MNESISSLKKIFKKINKMGYVESTRKGSTGIGKTFEDLIGKSEDSLSKPDFHGIEIKTKQVYSIRDTSLFCLAPFGTSSFESKRLANTYGYPDKVLRDSKVLYAQLYGNCLRCIAGKYLMGLEVDYINRRIKLKIVNMFLELIEDNVYWDFEDLEERLKSKLSYLAVVNASKINKKGQTYYHYKTIDFYKLRDFSTFLSLIELGIISIELRVGVVRSGVRIGQVDDKGTCFKIKESSMTQLFDKIDVE